MARDTLQTVGLRAVSELSELFTENTPETYLHDLRRFIALYTQDVRSWDLQHGSHYFGSRLESKVRDFTNAILAGIETRTELIEFLVRLDEVLQTQGDPIILYNNAYDALVGGIGAIASKRSELSTVWDDDTARKNLEHRKTFLEPKFHELVQHHLDEGMELGVSEIPEDLYDFIIAELRSSTSVEDLRNRAITMAYYLAEVRIGDERVFTSDLSGKAIAAAVIEIFWSEEGQLDDDRAASATEVKSIIETE